MLKQVDKNIWVTQKQLKYWGLQVATRMTVIRLENGQVVIISPIKIDELTINQINEIGKVNTIIALSLSTNKPCLNLPSTSIATLQHPWMKE